MNAAAIGELFCDHFGTNPKLNVRAPGRVNLLGEHVDYNDGPVLPAAIDRAVFLAATEEPSRSVVLYAADMGEEVSIDLDNLESKTCRQGEPLPGWALYPAGVAFALQNAGLEVCGVRVAYASDVPIGAGLSSSAAVEVGFAALWQAMGGWQVERLKLAQLCQKAENEYVGVACGLMDQFASACGVEGHALYFDTRSLDWRPAPLPEGTALVIADSGVRRDLTTSAYNERRAACERAVTILQEYLPDIHALRDVQVTECAAYSVMLPDIIRRRAEHVVKEIARVESALNALNRDDKQAMGALMYAGHKSLRELYEVSTPELDALVELSRGLEGCIGARLTGAGFGGCTINLVEAEQAQGFIEGLKAGYLERTGRRAQIYLCQASQGVTAEAW
jgi:galactokinase